MNAHARIPRPFTVRLALGILVFALSTGSLLAETILVPRGAGWRYLDNGLDQGTDWKELFFNDDAWGFGHAELGFGDAADGRPEVTVLDYGPDPFERYTTYYFRRFFYVADPAAFSNLVVRLLRDDGGVVYLNGTEVYRSGMPAGPVSFDTLAVTETSGALETRYFNGIANPGVLFGGINLLAVEVHLASLDSPDLSFDLELAANVDPLPQEATLARGPYLQLLNTNTVTVRWRTLEETPSQVRFGPALGTFPFAVADPSPVTEHELTLVNLSPNTRYFYDIGTQGGPISGGPDHYFVTAPMFAKPTRIWAIGDCGTATPDARAVFDRYREFTGSRDTDVWLLLGDNAYGAGTDAEYQRSVFDQYPELLRQTAVWSTMGNHETYSVEPDGHHAYFNIFSWPTAGQIGGEPSGTEHYYSFNYANIHFVCLDSEESGRTSGSPMLTWLEEDLAGNDQDWLIVFWHSPPYTKGSHDSDNIFDSGGNMIQMRANIVPILESHGADLVLCGHSHNYERSYLMNGHYGYSSSLNPSMILDGGSGRPRESGAYRKQGLGPTPSQGTVYVVAGSSGFATFQVGRHPIMQTALLRMGSLVLDIDGLRLDARFLRETGAIDDSFTILKGAAPEALRLTTLRLGLNTVTAQWKSSAGRVYMIQSASSPGGGWTAASDEITATGATTTWTDLAEVDAEKIFYRVVQIR